MPTPSAPTPTPPFPPTSKEFFIYKTDKSSWDGEARAEGFVMEFHASGNEFRIGIDLPEQAVHGPYMIIFYASFYSQGGHKSIVETGLSFSGKKGWNFTADLGGVAHDHPFLTDIAMGSHHELVVSFKPQKHGGVIQSRLGRYSSLVSVPQYEKIAKMRLVVAAGNREGASYGDASMTLTSIDSRPPTCPGAIVWQSGHKLDNSMHRSVLKSVSAFGLSCSLPPQAAPIKPLRSNEAAPKNEGSVRPLSLAEIHRMTLLP